MATLSMPKEATVVPSLAAQTPETTKESGGIASKLSTTCSECQMPSTIPELSLKQSIRAKSTRGITGDMQHARRAGLCEGNCGFFRACRLHSYEA